jgi:transglutaminase-like putative cysteine protease
LSAYSAVPALLQSMSGSASAITQATLNKMVRIVRKYKSDAGTVMAARRIIQAAQVPERDASGAIHALQMWVRDGVRYTPDPRGLEMVQTPPQVLASLTGDCDDKATLLATLLETIGFSTRFAAIAVNDEPFFSHVMAQVRLGARWVNLETILPGIGAGWVPGDVTEWKFYHV